VEGWGLVLIQEQEYVKKATLSVVVGLTRIDPSPPSADTAFLLVFFLSVLALEAWQRGGNDSEIKCGLLYLFFFYGFEWI
jgi:hypothetical protein